MDNIFSLNMAKPIWTNTNKVNHYVDFKTNFHIDSIEKDAKVYIAVDTEYVLFINGQFVNMGAYDDFPNNKSYDVLNVAEYLKTGDNELYITAYAQGIGSFQYIEGTPFLMFCLINGATKVVSNENILCCENPQYTSGEVDLISFQMAYSFIYDATKNNYAWEKAVLVDPDTVAKSFYERPIKKCVFEPRCESIIKAQGTLLRKSADGASVKEHMKSDYLSTLLPNDMYISRIENGVESTGYNQRNVVLKNADDSIKTIVSAAVPDGADGIYFVVDLVQMQAGLLELELEAAAGTQIEIGYGESIDDMRVRAYLINSTGKYICKEGRQKFTHYLKRLAGRYIQLHITNMKAPVTMIYCGFIPMNYPVNIIPFTTNDRLFDKIYSIAVRTLRMCMHEHYEDCPIREQGLYGFDGLNQMIFGYYAFNETDMPRACIRLLAEGLTEDGFIPLCAPSKWPEVIPMFSLAWMIALERYLIHTEDKAFGLEMLPVAEKIVETFSSFINNGILETPFGDAPHGSKIWNFYDWEYGLEDNERVEKVNDGHLRIDAPLNFGFCLMLKTIINVIKLSGADRSVDEYQRLYETVKENAHKKLYNEEKGLYVTFIGGTYPDHYCELSQALALVSGVSDSEALRDKLACKDNGMYKTNLSLMLYKYEALLQNPERNMPFILKEIEEIWGNMVYNNATTFWETSRGEEDFGKAASLCHGWSAIPIYIFRKYYK
ncbi:MAG: family 78 glycoside hydrolase catalytic domain [Clostridia bacterium]|nr:family 78 glycoside hydrolase catalytic domain [Clostridia bacterium]